jgi:hypothetical protein
LKTSLWVYLFGGKRQIFAEIACGLGSAGKVAAESRRRVGAQTTEAAEEEVLVVNDGAAQGRSVLVARIGLFGYLIVRDRGEVLRTIELKGRTASGVGLALPLLRRPVMLRPPSR